MEFNARQKEAIETINGPVMVVSCAGSGKTSVIIERAHHLVRSGIPAENVLVVTFSKAAATEMKERFSKQYGECGVKFSTIHSICYFILAKAYNLSASVVLGNDEKNSFLMDEYRRLKNLFAGDFESTYQDYSYFCNDIQLKISEYIYLTYIGKLPKIKTTEDRIIEDAAAAYIKFKRIAGKIDFDDMVINCHRYFIAQPDALNYWQEKFRYIMVDEYQDTNMIQAEIFFMLARERNICVVGDDDQAIYSFRNADVEVFHRFLSEYPEAKQIYLETNYRSQPQIIRLASNLISHNINRLFKIFKTQKQGRAVIAKIEVDGDSKQVDYVIQLIREYQRQGVPLQEIAVLYRIKKVASTLCSRLMTENIPFYTKELPEDLYAGMVYKDIKAYYRLANGLWEKNDLQRIINRPTRYIKADAVYNCKLDKNELMRRCLATTDSGERKEQISETITKFFYDLNYLKGKGPAEFMKYLVGMNYRESLIGFAEYIKKPSNTFADEFDELLVEASKFETMSEWDAHAKECRKKIIASMEQNKKIGVHLSTFHSAKGLQWKNVIIIAANEGVTPCIRGKDAIVNTEEERRLFYVAMTRAEEQLRVLYLMGENGVVPSPYISEMERQNIQEATEIASELHAIYAAEYHQAREDEELGGYGDDDYDYE